MSMVVVGHPQWVVLGSTTSDGRVMLCASNRLDGATLEKKRKAHEDYPFFIPYQLPDLEPVTLAARMNDYLVVVADTYEAAFTHLFRMWSPERKGESDGPVRGAEPGPSALEVGPAT